ncbi:hypothetical protein GCM10017607_11340 [Microbacterium thalassium]|nr:hypothetical protein GCM10017607_11340 [Microbacterium thalassium]
MRPRSITLWLDIPETSWEPTPWLKSQVSRGLTVRFTSNYGPHTKYYPYCLERPDAGSTLVTADDDILYPRNWLEVLWSEFLQSGGETVVCHRAHHIELADDNTIAPYLDWTRCTTTAPSPRIFATGVSGVIYPKRMVCALRDAGTAFLDEAPRADDVWLHRVALRERVPVRQATRAPLDLTAVSGTQAMSLGAANVFGEGNDLQIRATYSSADIARLQAG